MAQIVNDNRLVYVITQQGRERLADIMDPAKPDITSLDITKVKVGDANGEYYVPNGSDPDANLKHAIPGGEFPVLEKSMLEDNLTVSFRFVIPETFGNCDIREVGLYMKVGNREVPFAIGTQQPLVKPDIEYDYLISVDYYIYLQIANLAEVYDKIYLEPNDQLATETDLEDLMNTVLFSQTNLMDQIGHNSQIIGMDRAAQLQALIATNQNNVANSITYGNFANLLFYTNQGNIFSYWAFNQSKAETVGASITDLGPNGVNLSTNTDLRFFENEFVGMTPTLTIDNENYFYLDKNSDFPLILLNSSGTEDLDFTMAFALEPLSDHTSEGRIILARSNAASNNKVFELWETSGNRLRLVLFSDSNNFISFTSVEQVVPKGPHAVVLAYNHTDREVHAYLNGAEVTMEVAETGTYTHMNNTKTTLYAFSANPVNLIYSDSPTNPTKLYGSDGAPNLNPSYSIRDDKVYYRDVTECSYNSSKNIERPKLYAYVYGAHKIYTEDVTLSTDTVLYNEDYSLNTSSDYRIVEGSEAYVIQYSGNTMARSQYYDIDPSTIYAWEYEGSAVTIWADRASGPTALYDSSGNTYRGENWKIEGGYVKYNGETATYTSAYNRQVPFLETTSYITNGQGNKVNFTYSRVGVISVIKAMLPDARAKALSIALAASLGVNPCLIISE